MRRYSIFHVPVMSFYSRALYRDVGLRWKGIGFATETGRTQRRTGSCLLRARAISAVPATRAVIRAAQGHG